MPLYEYRCADCGAQFERLVRPGRTPEGTVCPTCASAQVERQFSTVALVGKGSCAPQPGSG